jgi:hypothetical protein
VAAIEVGGSRMKGGEPAEANMRPASLDKTWRFRLAQTLAVAGLFIAAACSQDAGDSPAPKPNNDTTTCTAPTQACNGACVNTNADLRNCGGCNVACTVGQVCQAGRCALSCTAPQLDCGGGSCSDPASNALHCGGCNRPCPGGQICQAGTCVTGSCPTGQTTCNGACVDTLTNPMHCGGCGLACQAGQTCQSGMCVTPGAGGGAGAGAGGSAGASGAGVSMGGSAGVATAGNAGTTTAGTSGSGGSAAGSGQGGTSTGGTPPTGGAGAGGGVSESSECPDITWPTPVGATKNLGSGMTVSGEYDGNMALHEGSLDNCAEGDQDSTDPLIEVPNGGTVRNVIFGSRVGDGIHCLGSCTIENVWFQYVCDDAISALGSGTVTIRNSGFKNARDKTIQHNGTGTVNIDNVYVETAGKLYRSCGEGCSGGNRTANISNIVAIGVDQVAGVGENDTVTLSNICVHRTFSICSIYEPGTSDESTQGVNGSNEGPNDNCRFSADDTHALLSRVSGIPFTTDSVCGGPNGYKSGSTATSCVDGFDKCLKACMPGGYGFKEITCTNGRYAEGTGVICAMPTDPTAAQNLAPSRVMAVSSPEVDNNAECSPEWSVAIDESNNAEYCVCVHKPGYYSNDNWLAWDCQRRWW